MKCEHCKTQYKESAMIEHLGKHFCCKGCAFVYDILNDEKLEDFYDKLGNTALNPAKIPQNIPNLSKYLQKTDEGFSLIYLIIPDIHCPACVWLNEKILIRQDGILELDINALTHKVRIVYDENAISLEQILRTIMSVGYTPQAFDRLEEDKKSKALKRVFYQKLIVALACLMNIMWIAVAKYAGFFSGMAQDIKDILNYAEFILCSPILFYTGSTFFSSAYFALKKRFINMDCLVITGALLAYFYSIWAMFSRSDEVYFDSVAMIITFVFVGKYLELQAKRHASNTLDILSELLGSEVNVIKDGKSVSLDAKEVQVGDVMELKSGDKVLLDGVCISGECLCDNSSLSGESMKLAIKASDELLSGSFIVEGYVLVKVQKSYENSTLFKLVNLIEEAAFKKNKIEIMANKISSYFSVAVLFIALLALFYYGFSIDGFKNCISVLIIACPCALALATPVTNIIALGVLLKAKVLLKTSDLLEKLKVCKSVVFDKTGVLTNELSVSELSLGGSSFKVGENDEKNLKVLKSLEDFKALDEMQALFSKSYHPLAHCANEFLIKAGFKAKKTSFDSFDSFAGKGVKACRGEDEFIAGSYQFLKSYGVEVATPLQTALFFAKNHELKASFYFNSSLREGALELISFLKALKIRSFILSGDNEAAVEKCAKELDISEFKASCLPKDKLDFLHSLKGIYLMVGDGVNDAPSLKFAPLSISLKSGSKLAIDSSDILLLNSDLLGIKAAFKVAFKSVAIIRQNLCFSLFYNALTIPLAFFGYLNPLFAALSMSLSSLVVILNALRLKNTF